MGEYRTGGRPLTLYVRGSLQRRGHHARDGWITDEGVTLAGTLADLKRCRRIELRPANMPNYLSRVPSVTAELILPGRVPQLLPASATADLEAVNVNWRPVDLPAETPVTIRIRFDSSFVPPTRGLVSILAPWSCTLAPSRTRP